MYYSEKITPEMVRQIQEGEDRRHYKTAGSRIVFVRNCEHCNDEYWPARKNQKYCCPSCRVRACNKRNGYQNGRPNKQKANKSDNRVAKIDAQTEEVRGIDKSSSTENTSKPQLPPWDWNRVGESAAGSAAINGMKYLLHDREMMHKIDLLLQLVQNSPLVKIPVSTKPLYYLGLKFIGNTIAAIFQNPKDGKAFAHDQDGRWYTLNGNHWAKL